jgi:subtilisin family serine protease
VRRRLWRALVGVATLGLLAASLAAAPVALAGTNQTYIVLYRSLSVSTDAATRISRADGTLVASYGQIGVAIATSSSSTFATTLGRDSRIAAVASTAGSGFHLQEPQADDTTAVPDSPAPGSDSEPLSGLQWDMAQIHVFDAHEIEGGSSDVIVGDIDTGLDYTHPDLAPNVDDADSANCVSGVAVQGMVAANDDNGHGTHTAGTIAAAVNGIGITGVAPNVKIAGIKAGNADGFFFPESVICAFMWAGSHGVKVTNNSYFADPWLFNCKNDKAQKAIYSAEQRAIQWAMSQGVTVVAAEGNQADDLAHPTQDATSPDDTTPVVRDITNACAVVPVEVPGVIGVTADGNLGFKSFYSSYGLGTADVMAPGGDSRLQVTAAAPNGRVLSTFPSWAPCTRLVVDNGAHYCYLQGTSMASPHVAGLAALVASQHPDWSSGAITGRITSTADPVDCPPDMSIYAFFPALDGGAPQVCSGGPTYNSFSGHGQVNALSAVQ